LSDVVILDSMIEYNWKIRTLNIGLFVIPTFF